MSKRGKKQEQVWLVLLAKMYIYNFIVPSGKKNSSNKCHKSHYFLQVVQMNTQLSYSESCKL